LFAYFNDCWDTSKDEEHPPLVGGVWGFVDRNESTTISKRNHPKDIETKEHQFIPISLSTTKNKNFAGIKSSGLMALIVLIKVVF
jgi:hypothetical protein